MSIGGGGGKGRERVRERVDIPAFLQPLITDATGTARGALATLAGRSRGDLVAPFTPAQELAQNLAIREALAGEAFPAAEEAFLETTRGLGLEDFLPAEAFEALTTSAAGIPLADFVPPIALETFTGAAGGVSPTAATLRTLAEQTGLPESTVRRLAASGSTLAAVTSSV